VIIGSVEKYPVDSEFPLKPTESMQATHKKGGSLWRTAFHPFFY
jgi:hypothetical protein